MPYYEWMSLALSYAVLFIAFCHGVRGMLLHFRLRRKNPNFFTWSKEIKESREYADMRRSWLMFYGLAIASFLFLFFVLQPIGRWLGQID